MDMTISETQKLRVKKTWEEYVKESLTIEATEIGKPIYAFGSELACLRLFHRMKVGKVYFSSNLNTWIYCNK